MDGQVPSDGNRIPRKKARIEEGQELRTQVFASAASADKESQLLLPELMTLLSSSSTDDCIHGMQLFRKEVWRNGNLNLLSQYCMASPGSHDLIHLWQSLGNRRTSPMAMNLVETWIMLLQQMPKIQGQATSILQLIKSLLGMLSSIMGLCSQGPKGQRLVLNLLTGIITSSSTYARDLILRLDWHASMWGQIFKGRGSSSDRGGGAGGDTASAPAPHLTPRSAGLSLLAVCLPLAEKDVQVRGALLVPSLWQAVLVGMEHADDATVRKGLTTCLLPLLEGGWVRRQQRSALFPPHAIWTLLLRIDAWGQRHDPHWQDIYKMTVKLVGQSLWQQGSDWPAGLLVGGVRRLVSAAPFWVRSHLLQTVARTRPYDVMPLLLGSLSLPLGSLSVPRLEAETEVPSAETILQMEMLDVLGDLLEMPVHWNVFAQKGNPSRAKGICLPVTLTRSLLYAGLQPKMPLALTLRSIRLCRGMLSRFQALTLHCKDCWRRDNTNRHASPDSQLGLEDRLEHWWIAVRDDVQAVCPDLQAVLAATLAAIAALKASERRNLDSSLDGARQPELERCHGLLLLLLDYSRVMRDQWVQSKVDLSSLAAVMMMVPSRAEEGDPYLPMAAVVRQFLWESSSLQWLLQPSHQELFLAIIEGLQRERSGQTQLPTSSSSSSSFSCSWTALLHRLLRESGSFHLAETEIDIWLLMAPAYPTALLSRLGRCVHQLAEASDRAHTVRDHCQAAGLDLCPSPLVCLSFPAAGEAEGEAEADLLQQRVITLLQQWHRWPSNSNLPSPVVELLSLRDWKSLTPVEMTDTGLLEGTPHQALLGTPADWTQLRAFLSTAAKWSVTQWLAYQPWHLLVVEHALCRLREENEKEKEKEKEVTSSWEGWMTVVQALQAYPSPQPSVLSRFWQDALEEWIRRSSWRMAKHSNSNISSSSSEVDASPPLSQCLSWLCAQTKVPASSQESAATLSHGARMILETQATMQYPISLDWLQWALDQSLRSVSESMVPLLEGLLAPHWPPPTPHPAFAGLSLPLPLPLAEQGWASILAAQLPTPVGKLPILAWQGVTLHCLKDPSYLLEHLQTLWPLAIAYIRSDSSSDSKEEEKKKKKKKKESREQTLEQKENAWHPVVVALSLMAPLVTEREREEFLSLHACLPIAAVRYVWKEWKQGHIDSGWEGLKVLRQEWEEASQLEGMSAEHWDDAMASPDLQLPAQWRHPACMAYRACHWQPDAEEMGNEEVVTGILEGLLTGMILHKPMHGAPLTLGMERLLHALRTLLMQWLQWSSSSSSQQQRLPVALHANKLFAAWKVLGMSAWISGKEWFLSYLTGTALLFLILPLDTDMNHCRYRLLTLLLSEPTSGSGPTLLTSSAVSEEGDEQTERRSEDAWLDTTLGAMVIRALIPPAEESEEAEGMEGMAAAATTLPLEMFDHLLSHWNGTVSLKDMLLASILQQCSHQHAEVDFMLGATYREYRKLWSKDNANGNENEKVVDEQTAAVAREQLLLVAFAEHSLASVSEVRPAWKYTAPLSVSVSNNDSDSDSPRIPYQWFCERNLLSSAHDRFQGLGEGAMDPWALLQLYTHGLRNAWVSPTRLLQSGVLSLAVACTAASWPDQRIRQVAFHCLQACYQVICATEHWEEWKEIYLFLDWMRNSTIQPYEGHSMLQSSALAEMVLLLNQPQHSLYLVCVKYWMKRPFLRPNEIPLIRQYCHPWGAADATVPLSSGEKRQQWLWSLGALQTVHAPSELTLVHSAQLLPLLLMGANAALREGDIDLPLLAGHCQAMEAILAAEGGEGYWERAGGCQFLSLWLEKLIPLKVVGAVFDVCVDSLWRMMTHALRGSVEGGKRRQKKSSQGQSLLLMAPMLRCLVRGVIEWLPHPQRQSLLEGAVLRDLWQLLLTSPDSPKLWAMLSWEETMLLQLLQQLIDSMQKKHSTRGKHMQHGVLTHSSSRRLLYRGIVYALSQGQWSPSEAIQAVVTRLWQMESVVWGETETETETDNAQPQERIISARMVRGMERGTNPPCSPVLLALSRTILGEE
jgi:hypothetical protein